MLPEGKPLSAKIESQVPEGLEPAHGKTAAWVNWNYFEEDDAVDAVRLYVMNEVWGDDDYVESEEEEEEEEEDEDDDEEGEGEDKADEAQVDDVGSSLR